MKVIVSIDPGASGGIAIAHPHGQVVSYAMPETDGDLLEALSSIHVEAKREGYTVVCYLENLVKFAGNNQSGSAMAVYASNWGIIKGIVITLGWRLVLVTPQRWQKHLGLGTRGQTTKTQWKNKLKQRAQQLYPGHSITLKTADAILMVEYAIHTEK